MTGGFCAECQFILDRRDMLTDPYNIAKYHHHLIALEDSVKGGCQLCQLFLSCLSDHDLRIWRESYDTKMKYWARGAPQDNCYELIVFTPAETGNNRVYTKYPTISLHVTAVVEHNSLNDEQEVEQSTSSCQGLDLARSWFETCTGSHLVCQAPGSFNYPTRLLAFEFGVLHLVFTSEMLDHPNYATLSHCWGNSMPLRLEIGNLNDFRAEIPQSKLCKTFKDAITIAKYLSLQYL
ncbi:hypothetical protein G7Y89_g3763 [Cudoniella acicularis]|uniref:Uncharacterized protein n=1 Tax=Cudoniella acicularis TaxID=354080 RepID=A0A8H4W5A7_9HELO|nr:hypothetical protein G7Y89_g3763 [Cudoniella acicularis]